MPFGYFLGQLMNMRFSRQSGINKDDTNVLERLNFTNIVVVKKNLQGFTRFLLGRMKYNNICLISIFICSHYIGTYSHCETCFNSALRIA